MKKRVLIESPFAGNIVANLNYLREAIRDSLSRGEAPFASHGFYTQFLLDDNKAERALGIECGFAWGAMADLVAVYDDLGVTPGMLEGLENASNFGVPIEYRKIG